MDAADIQRMAEQRKKEYEAAKASAPTKETSPSRETRQREAVEVTQETRSCIHCGQSFEATVTAVFGSKITANVCTSCADDDPARPTIDVQQSLSKIGVNVRRHGECTIDGFEGNRLPADAAHRFVSEVRAAGYWSSVRGLLLCGNTGTGKTHLAVAIIRALVATGTPPHKIIFDRASRLITEIQDTYGTGKTAKVLEARESALLWVLDDLGAEKATADSLRILHDLLDAREGHPNVITTNFMPDEMGRRFKDEDGWARIASRLASRNFRAVKVNGADRRFAA